MATTEPSADGGKPDAGSSGAGDGGSAAAAANSGSSNAGGGGSGGGDASQADSQSSKDAGANVPLDPIDGGSNAPRETGTLPPVADLEKLGPFTPARLDNTGPRSEYQIFYPAELGKDGVRHPIVLFGQGGGFTDNYATLLRYISSHGFVVICYWVTPQSKELIEGLDWLIEQDKAASGRWSGKLDTTRVAGAGHSYGSLGIFNIAGDPRIKTTVHLQGGTLDPHKEVANLREPAAFICGESPKGDDDGTWTGDMANPNCAADFAAAKVPVFYASLTGAAHIQLTDAVEDMNDARRLKMIGAILGWLRWRLAEDRTLKTRYVGSDCELCKPDSGWVVKKKGLM